MLCSAKLRSFALEAACFSSEPFLVQLKRESGWKGEQGKSLVWQLRTNSKTMETNISLLTTGDQVSLTVSTPLNNGSKSWTVSPRPNSSHYTYVRADWLCLYLRAFEVELTRALWVAQGSCNRISNLSEFFSKCVKISLQNIWGDQTKSGICCFREQSPKRYFASVCLDVVLESPETESELTVIYYVFLGWFVVVVVLCSFLGNLLLI